jgi:hypothetical protein
MKRRSTLKEVVVMVEEVAVAEDAEELVMEVDLVVDLVVKEATVALVVVEDAVAEEGAEEEEKTMNFPGLQSPN